MFTTLLNSTALDTKTVSSAQLDFLTDDTFKVAFAEIKKRRSLAKEATTERDLGTVSITALSPERIICGKCNEPKAKHQQFPNYKRTWNPRTKRYVPLYVVANYDDDFKVYCSRSYDQIGNPEFDYASINTTDLPIPEVVQADFDDNSDPYEYESPVEEWERIERYHDRMPEEHTVTYEQYLQGARTVSWGNVEPESRNVYVEGQEGFVSVQVLNEWLTRKYHARLLNVFVNKAGKVQIGSVVLQNITLRDNADGTREALCLKCKGRLIVPDTTDHEAQAEFTYAVIAHGNNHAAKWFRERGSYYPLHHSLLPKVEEDADLIVQHHKSCTTIGCSCTDLLLNGVSN